MFTWYIVELSVLSALVSLFLDFCFREGNIFEGWLDFWADVFLSEDLPDDLDRETRFKLVDWFWFKPLGYCVVCMNVWISLITCLLFYRDWKFVLVVLLSSFLVRITHERLL